MMSSFRCCDRMSGLASLWAERSGGAEVIDGSVATASGRRKPHAQDNGWSSNGPASEFTQLRKHSQNRTRCIVSTKVL